MLIKSNYHLGSVMAKKKREMLSNVIKTSGIRKQLQGNLCILAVHQSSFRSLNIAILLIFFLGK